MAAPRFEHLEDEYADLLKTAVSTQRMAGAAKATARKIMAGKERYQAVGRTTGVPWIAIALVHAMESGCRWTTHLHNGDSLKRRTRQVPRGRPRTGSPPFTWEESAIDAIRYDGLDKVETWTLERLCYELEKYNGWGYRKYHPTVLSPYLWSGTSHYVRGKYVADGRWSSRAVSGQTGAIAILKQVEALDVEVLADFKPKDIEEIEAEPIEELTPESYAPARQPDPVPVSAKVGVGAGGAVAISTAASQMIPPAPPETITKGVENVTAWQGIGQTASAFAQFAGEQPYIVGGIGLLVAFLIFGPRFLPEKWRIS